MKNLKNAYFAKNKKMGNILLFNSHKYLTRVWDFWHI
jgi:hypothetical protein